MNVYMYVLYMYVCIMYICMSYSNLNILVNARSARSEAINDKFHALENKPADL